MNVHFISVTLSLTNKAHNMKETMKALVYGGPGKIEVMVVGRRWRISL